MNILMISSRSDMGGGPKHLLQLISSNDYSEDNVFVACPDVGEFFADFVSCVGEDNVFIIPHRKFSFIYLFRLIKFCKKNKIHVIHSHGKGAGLYSRLIKLFYPAVNVVHTFHGVHIAGHAFFYKFFYRVYEILFIFFTAKIIAVSPSEKCSIDDLLYGFFTSKIFIINNGVFVPDEIPVKDFIDKINLLVVSRFDYQKNSDALIDIVLKINESCPEIIDCLYVLGDGLDRLHVQDRFKHLSFMVKFLGNVSSPGNVFARCHVILNTSRWEGLPLSVLESMAYGVVPVLSRVVGNVDILSDSENVGCLYDLYNLDECVNFLSNLIKNESNCYEMFSRNSRALILHKYSQSKMTYETRKLYPVQEGF